MNKLILAAAALAITVSAAASASAANFLANAGFEAVTTGATSSSFQGDGGVSAAPSWLLYNNAPAGLLASETLTSTAPGGETQMLHLATSGPFDGVYQAFAGGLAQYAQVSVRVLSGQVALYLYSNGGGHEDGVAFSTAGDGWQTLSLNTGSPGSDEIVIYAVGGAAEFYVDNAYASDAAPSAAPEPAAWALMIIGFAGAGAALRRRRAFA